MVPFLLILVGNSMLVHHLLVIQKRTIGPNLSHNAHKNRKSFSYSILSYTVSFIILTAPFAFIGNIFNKDYRIDN